jgi:hypothetical protein
MQITAFSIRACSSSKDYVAQNDGDRSENHFYATPGLTGLESKGGTLMALGNALLTTLPEFFGGQDFLLSALLVCALIVTYFWSVLGTKLKLTLCFSGGVFLFKALFDQLIDRRLFPDLHSYLPYVLGGITAGLLEIGAFLLENRTVIIGTFFGGAIFPLLCLARIDYLDFAGGLVIPLFAVAAAIVTFCSLAKLKVTRTKLFHMVISAIAGGLGVVYLIIIHGVASNRQLLGIDAFRAIGDAVQYNCLYSAVCLMISGIVVQSLLHLALRQIRRPEQEPFT